MPFNYPFFQAFDNNGNFLDGGKLYAYSAGTDNPRDTWSDAVLSTKNRNPVELGPRGEALIYGTGSYKFILTDANDVEIWSIDDQSMGTSPYVTPEMFGSSVQDAIDFAASTNTAVMLTPKTTYTMSETLLWPQRHVPIIGGIGSVLDFSAGFTGTYAIQYTDLTDSIEQAGHGLMQSVIIKGPAASSNKDGLYLNATSNAAGAFVHYDRVDLYGFRRQVVLGDQACFSYFDRCRLVSTNYDNTEIGIYILSATNSGECMVFSNCQFTGLLKIIENTLTYNGGLTFNNCAFDYSKQVIYSPYYIYITINQSNIESNHFDLPWIDIEGNTRVEINQALIIATAEVSNYLFKTATIGSGGIYLRDSSMSNSAGFSAGIDYLTDPTSTGIVSWRDRGGFVGMTPLPIGFGTNLVPFLTSSADFQKILEVHVNGVTDASTLGVSSAVKYRSLNTTTISTGTTGHEIARDITIPVSPTPGLIGASIYIKATGFGVSEWEIRGFMVDRLGNVISSLTAFDSLTTTADFVKYYWYFDTIISGTAAFKIEIYAQPQNAGETNRVLYLADYVVNQM